MQSRACLAVAMVTACSALLFQQAACSVANPLLQQRLLGGEAAHHRVYHTADSQGKAIADPAPRQLGGQCGVVACDDIPFPTPWSKDVDREHPWPEYPRPQLQRDDWLNLNGVWEFEATDNGGHLAPAFNRTLADKILVPFPPEAPLSGQKRPDGSSVRLLYKRTFSMPSSWSGKRIMIHFGAVDYEAIVMINSRTVGWHRGGYNKFSFDITDALEQGSGSRQGLGEAEHELVVRVWDPADLQRITIGKQRLFPPRHPAGIWYTSTSGIWQTVWLEPVPEAHITQIVPTADIAASAVWLEVRSSAAAAGHHAVAVVSSEGNALATACGPISGLLTAQLESPRLWSPEQPHLYDVDVRLVQPGQEASCEELGRQLWKEVQEPGLVQQASSRAAIAWEAARSLLGRFMPAAKALVRTEQQADHVRAYFGMREVSLGPVGPGDHPRPLINGEFVFQIGMLDQGYWPDGIYAAPTDDALIYDLKAAKALGFNMLRKHTKIEPDRWYYHADRLGVLVWQDQPDQFGDDHPPQAIKDQFEGELRTMIEQHREFPSIINWVVFNEGWGQYETPRMTEWVKKLDPSRLADCASGWTDSPVGDFIDRHDYVGPSSPLPTKTRAAVLGEFGGLGLRVEGHRFVPQEDFCYELQESSAKLETRYLGLVENLKKLMTSNETALSAAVYTELCDVEGEINGFLTYDRQVVKVGPDALPQAHKSLLDLSRSLNKKAHS